MGGPCNLASAHLIWGSISVHGQHVPGLFLDSQWYLFNSLPYKLLDIFMESKKERCLYRTLSQELWCLWSLYSISDRSHLRLQYNQGNQWDVNRDVYSEMIQYLHKGSFLQSRTALSLLSQMGCTPAWPWNLQHSFLVMQHICQWIMEGIPSVE